MAQVARIGDRTFGICHGHKSPIAVGGTIVTGDPQVTADGVSVARLNDLVNPDCTPAHRSKIVTASLTVTASNIQIARLGDIVSGGPYSASIITASADVYVE